MVKPQGALECIEKEPNYLGKGGGERRETLRSPSLLPFPRKSELAQVLPERTQLSNTRKGESLRVFFLFRFFFLKRLLVRASMLLITFNSGWNLNCGKAKTLKHVCLLFIDCITFVFPSICFWFGFGGFFF